MSKRLYFALILVGTTLALGGVAVQLWTANTAMQARDVRIEKRVVDGLQVCKLAKDWQDIMREQHPDKDRRLPELQSVAGACPSLEH